MSPSFRLHAERTPNPESIKWVLSEPVAPDGVSASFKEAVETDVSPLAARLFAVDGVVGVFFAANFITTTKRVDNVCAKICDGFDRLVTLALDELHQQK